MDAAALFRNLFSPAHRLYSMDGTGPLDALAIEAWIGREAISELFEWRIVTVSANPSLSLDAFLGQRLTLSTTLAGGGQTARSGLVRQAEKLGADGGLARYRLTVVPWLWLTTQQRHSQVFQQRTLDSIIDEVLRPYAPYASWRYAPGALARIGMARKWPHIAQYRETDYHFVSRLLAEAGLGYSVVEDQEAPHRHTVLIFADSTRLDEDPESATTSGIRYHRADSQEATDAVQQLTCETRSAIPGVSVTAWDAEAKRTVRGHAPARFGSMQGMPDSYLSVSPSLAPDAEAAQRVAEQVMEAIEARALLFTGAATVRTLRAGTRFAVTGCPHLPPPENDTDGYPLLLDAVEHCGFNNLGHDTQAELSKRLGAPEAALTLDNAPDAPESMAEIQGLLGPPPMPARNATPPHLVTAAREHGYGALLRAFDARRPWRAPILGADCPRLYSRPVPLGVHTAIVVGPDGQTSADGNAEHHVSRQGHVRVRFLWQRGERADDRSSRWIRVAQRQAGAGMGWQWLPRIGQEVLVKFSDDDIDQPFVLAAVYNGQGEAGIAPTPGGRALCGTTFSQPYDAEGLYAQGSDTHRSAQGNLAQGNSPPWHGMSPDAQGHRNAAALTGFKSQEHGGKGHNQLVLDDSDAQLRAQLATTQAATQLNLGHVVHQQDNRRGSFRGQGFELRTDGYAAVRGRAGLLLTTYRDAVTGRTLPTGDNAAGIALLRQGSDLARTLGQAAAVHQVPPLSVAADEQAPLPAQARAAAGMVDGQDLDAALADAAAGNTATTAGKVPHQAEPMVHLSGRAGISVVAGQDLQLANGESVALLSGQDHSIAVAGQGRVHAGQAIGIAAGLSAAGEGNVGLQVTAGQDDIDLQAQHDLLKLAAREDLVIVSANMNVDFASAKRIRLATAGGASITLEGGNITVECPGPITYKAAQRKFEGPVNTPYPLPVFPQHACLDCLLKAAAAGSHLAAA
ncbi:type VI secretion system Vgr family protein [Cupriavidus taiwanensis]|uniref:Type VI secretion protein n=1 Tax=Cupriavidus taiwanensis TaxID=164546 RepID=A0A375BCA1_9BURK|nr:conserved hypothetical protein [Cupriavidus taiwanensis]